MTRGLTTILALLCVGTAFAQEARVEYVAGDVRVTSAGVTTDADFGMALKQGDVVETGADGVAVVTVSAGSEIKLRENTSVVLSDVVTNGSVELQRGGLFARVDRAVTGGRQRFSVRTPTVVAGVRGTEFFVAYGREIEDRADVWLCVNDGTVEVSVPAADTTTLVNEGEGVNILNGTRTTDPKFYDWTTELNWNFDPTAGDVRDETDLDAAYSDLLDQDYD